jgi:hypothetical protein
LKPVIKKQTHYNVLLMRDDRESITFRVHSSLLHFCIGLCLALVLCGGAGIYGGLHFFTKYRELAAVQEARERENAEMRLQLERLVNLESLLKTGNESAPQATYTEVGAPDLPALGAAAADPSAPESPAPSPAGKPADGQQTSAPPASEGAPPSAGAPAAPTGADDGHAPLSGADCPLRITEFNAKNLGSLRLRISYELSTVTDGQRTVTGTARYAAVTTDGSQIDLPLQDQESARFAILRMKPMQNTVRLPAGLKPETIASIDILIEVADTVYRAGHPVSLQ